MNERLLAGMRTIVAVDAKSLGASAQTGFALRASAMGTVRTETLRDFTADEMSAILSIVG